MSRVADAVRQNAPVYGEDALRTLARDTGDYHHAGRGWPGTNGEALDRKRRLYLAALGPVLSVAAVVLSAGLQSVFVWGAAPICAAALWRHAMRPEVAGADAREAPR
jgi:hypothetical protein